MNDRERDRERVTKSINGVILCVFVCSSGYKCVCVGVSVSAPRLGFIYSALTKPLHQMGTNRVMEERERKQRGREKWDVYAPYPQP